MQGGEENRLEQDGIIPRTAAEIFDRISEVDGPADANMEFVFEVSYIEIYMEQVRDLLDTQGVRKLQIREDNRGGLYLKNSR